MDIIIRGRDVPVSDSLETHCHERVRRAVQPFAERVARVEIVFAKVSGLHVAPAHTCRVFVRLASGARLIFESSDRDHYRAVSRATFGAGRHLARTVDKWRTSARPRIEPLGAA